MSIVALKSAETHNVSVKHIRFPRARLTQSDDIVIALGVPQPDAEVAHAFNKHLLRNSFCSVMPFSRSGTEITCREPRF